jgi:hypothetical protein
MAVMECPFFVEEKRICGMHKTNTITFRIGNHQSLHGRELYSLSYSKLHSRHSLFNFRNGFRDTLR